MANKRIKDLATSITAFRTGDVIPVDGPSGTAKMSKDDLLKETAQNALVTGSASVKDFVINEYTNNMTSYAGIIGATNTWFNGGRHVAIEVNAGETLFIYPKSVNATDSTYVFVTNSYTPGDHTSGTVPFAGGQTARVIINLNEYTQVTAPKDAAYLILPVVDGDNNPVIHEVKRLFSHNETFAELYDGASVKKNVFVKDFKQEDFTIYNGIVGSDNNWFNGGKHIAIPLSDGDYVEITPDVNAAYSVVDSSYTPADHTSGKVPFSFLTVGRVLVNSDEKCTITAIGDSKFIILHCVAGDNVTMIHWTIRRTQTDADEVADLFKDKNFEVVQTDNYSTYLGSLSSTGTWFSGSGASHKAIPVTVGESLVIKNPMNAMLIVGFVTSAYTPADHTSGKVPYAGGATGRTLVNAGTSIEVTAPSDAAYLIIVVVDGDGGALSYEILKRTSAHEVKSIFAKIRYAHWNIGHFAMGMSNTTTIAPEDKALKQSEYRAYINSIHPDILGVCEDNVTFCTDGALSKDAVYSCFKQQHQGKVSGYMMNSIYSNGLKILQFSTQAFPNDGGYGFSEILCELNGKIVIFCETHLVWTKYAKRKAQMDYLIARYANVDYVVVSGDLNLAQGDSVDDESTEVQEFRDAGYTLSLMDYMPWQSTYCGNSSTPEYPDNAVCIDLIMCKGFGLMNSQVNQDGASLSDHRLVLCDLIMNA